MTDYHRALALATKYHAGQTRKNGETGLYWVKEFKTYDWEIAYWNGSCWLVYPNGYDEDCFSVIGPKIEEPREE